MGKTPEHARSHAHSINTPFHDCAKELLLTPCAENCKCECCARKKQSIPLTSNLSCRIQHETRRGHTKISRTKKYPFHVRKSMQNTSTKSYLTKIQKRWVWYICSYVRTLQSIAPCHYVLLALLLTWESPLPAVALLSCWTDTSQGFQGMKNSAVVYHCLQFSWKVKLNSGLPLLHFAQY